MLGSFTSAHPLYWVISQKSHVFKLSTNPENRNNYTDKEQNIQPHIAIGCVSHYQPWALVPSLRGHPRPHSKHTTPTLLAPLLSVWVSMYANPAALLGNRWRGGRRVRKGQRWLGVVLACFCWLTSNKKCNTKRNRRMRESVKLGTQRSGIRRMIWRSGEMYETFSGVCLTKRRNDVGWRV